MERLPIIKGNYPQSGSQPLLPSAALSWVHRRFGGKRTPVAAAGPPQSLDQVVHTNPGVIIRPLPHLFCPKDGDDARYAVAGSHIKFSGAPLY